MSSTISARAEDYLEAIWLLTREGGGAHTTDIAKKLEVRKSSVTEAIQSLAKKGLLNYQQYAEVTLTKAGEKLGRDVDQRHEVLRKFLIQVLHINPAKADKEACKMEHAVSREVIERLIEFTKCVGLCEKAETSCFRGLSYMKEEGEKMTADQLKPGDRATVIKLTAKGPVRKRMADMGVSKGTILEVKRIAPMGDPIDFKLKGYHLSLRKTEAAGIEIELNHE